MKILHLTKKYPKALGGDAVVVVNLEKQQQKAGHEVFILTSNCPEIIEKENVVKFGLKDSAPDQDRVTCRRIISLFILLLSGSRLIRKIKPDVIHSHSADLGFIISFPAMIHNIPVINTCHGVTFPYRQYSFFKRSAEKFFLMHGRFKSIITVDKNSLRFFKDIKVDNAVYIPNGVDIERFNSKRLKKKDENEIKFLFAGRLETQKGIKYLIRAVEILLNRTDNFKVLLIGDGSQREELEDLICRNNLNDHMVCFGIITDDELRDLYCTYDAFILPSVWEGFPLTILEAWAAGLPVISTNVGGIPDICENNKNALLVPPKNPEALASAMYMLIKDEGLRNKLGNNGRKLSLDYTWRYIANRIEDEYCGK